MIVEKKIVEALKFFGHMDKTEIDQKLQAIGMKIEIRDLDQCINCLSIG